MSNRHSEPNLDILKSDIEIKVEEQIFRVDVPLGSYLWFFLPRKQYYAVKVRNVGCKKNNVINLIRLNVRYLVSSNFRYDINGLRAIAVLSVVFFILMKIYCQEVS